MRTRSILTYKAEVAVKYRYTCEQCKHQTEWYESKLQQFASSSTRGKRFDPIQIPDPKSMEKAENEALERLQGLISIIKKAVNITPIREIIFDNDAVSAQFYEAFPRGKSCPRCRYRQTWYPNNSAKKRSKRQRKNHPRRFLPEVEWGEPAVWLLGTSEIDEDDAVKKEKTFTHRIINKKVREGETLVYNQICGLEHDNILYVKDVLNCGYGVFSVEEENFEGTSLFVLFKTRVKEGNFQDYVLQLCDALEFLHHKKNRITHNAIYPENIIVGKGNLLKLAHFDKATTGSPPTGDIAMLGALMELNQQKYMKRYCTIIKNCNSGVYQTIDDFRVEFLPLTKERSPISKIGLILFILLAVLAIFARRLL